MKIKTISKFSIIFFMLVCAIACFLVCGCKNNSPYSGDEINIETIRNSSIVKFHINDIDKYNFQDVNVHLKVKYNEKTPREKDFTIHKSDFKNGEYSYDVEIYGKIYVDIKFDNDLVCNDREIAVSADTYNISVLSGSLAVSYFFLDMYGPDSIRKSGPVIMSLQRGNMVDWDKLPKAHDGYYSVLSCPYLPLEKAEVLTNKILYADQLKMFKEYVGSLMDIDPTSHINFYITDQYAGGINTVLYANAVKNYSVKIYTEDRFTYDNLENTFNANYDENIQINKEAISQWNHDKKRAISEKEVIGVGKTGKTKDAYSVICAENKAKFIITNKSYLQTHNDGEQFSNDMKDNPNFIEEKLDQKFKKTLSACSPGEVEEFKTIFNFNSNYFEEATRDHKEVLMIIGGRDDNEGHGDLDDLGAMIDCIRGALDSNNYVIYYKAHPYAPTSTNPDKQKLLKEKNVIDVDSYVPAEMILFFNPSIYLCGYESSTFSSVPDGNALCMFRMTKSRGMNHDVSAYHFCKEWISKIDDNSPDNLKSICNMDHEVYLVELSEDIQKQYNCEISIWDETDHTLKNYKFSDGRYVQVN